MSAPGGDRAYDDDVSPAAGHAGATTPLVAPATPQLAPSIEDSTRNSYAGAAPATPDVSRPFLAPGAASKENIVESGGRRGVVRRRWPLFAGAGAAAVVVIVLAVVLPVTLVHKHHSSGGGSGGSSGANAASPTSNPESPSGAVTGGNGSQITTEDGVTFTYVNNFGGFCKFLLLSAYARS